VSEPKGVLIWVPMCSVPMGFGFGSFPVRTLNGLGWVRVRIQEGWGLGPYPDPKWVKVWVLSCPNPRGLWVRSVAGPNLVGGEVRI